MFINQCTTRCLAWIRHIHRIIYFGAWSPDILSYTYITKYAHQHTCIHSCDIKFTTSHISHTQFFLRCNKLCYKAYLVCAGNCVILWCTYHRYHSYIGLIIKIPDNAQIHFCQVRGACYTQVSQCILFKSYLNEIKLSNIHGTWCPCKYLVWIVNHHQKWLKTLFDVNWLWLRSSLGRLTGGPEVGVFDGPGVLADRLIWKKNI